MGLYVDRWGDTPQKPCFAVDRSLATVKRRRHEEYPVIAASAKADDAGFHWDNEADLRSDEVL